MGLGYGVIGGDWWGINLIFVATFEIINLTL
jgi:hypothetical protein